MRLRNKKTGKVIEWFNNTDGIFPNSLAELNEEWEDYQESETFWYISPTGTPIKSTTSIYDPLEIHLMKRIGNYFESEEDAEMAVEKLVALKRLKDEGFRFTGYSHYDWNGNESPAIAFEYSDFDKMFDDKRVVADLDLLFGDKDDDMPTNAEINDLTDMGY